MRNDMLTIEKSRAIRMSFGFLYIYKIFYSNHYKSIDSLKSDKMSLIEMLLISQKVLFISKKKSASR